MSTKDLQKSAEMDQGKNDLPPKEVLNAKETARHYTFHLYPPSVALQPFVDCYWIMRWDLRGKAPFVAEVIPSPYTNLTFMPEGARITGVTTGKYTYELKGEGSIIGAKLKPGGLYAFWKRSLQELTDTHVSAFALFPEVDAIYNLTMLRLDDNEVVKRIEALLRKLKPTVDKNFMTITKVLQYLENTESPLLSGAAKHAGLSERRLQELFSEYVGVGIKWIILRSRLIKAVELATTLDNPNWTTIAYELGYTDQSHFSNDFKRIVGKSPRQYAADLGS